MKKTLICISMALTAATANAESFVRYFCETRMGDLSSTSKAIGAGTSALGRAGVRAVVHSSGELILSGAAGYIGGTLGVVAGSVAAAPAIATTLGVIGAADAGCALLPADAPEVSQEVFVPNRFMLRLSAEEVAHIDALRDYLRTTENRNLDRRQVALLALARLITLSKEQEPAADLPAPSLLTTGSSPVLPRPGASFHVWLPRPSMAELDQLRQQHAQKTGQSLSRSQMIAHAVDQYFGLIPQ